MQHETTGIDILLRSWSWAQSSWTETDERGTRRVRSPSPLPTDDELSVSLKRIRLR